MDQSRPQRTTFKHRPVVRTLLSMVLASAISASGIVATATPAVAAPATPAFGAAIDAYASNDPQRTCDPTAKPGVVGFRDLLNATYGGRNSSITRACNVGGTSEHKEGRALDYSLLVTDPGQNAIANDILNWLFATDVHGNTHANARRLGIMYIIWNRHIWSAYLPSSGWRAYSGPNPHTDHIHFSFSWAGALQQTSWWRPPPVFREFGLPGGRGVTYGQSTQIFAVSGDESRSLLQRVFVPGEGWRGWANLGGSLLGQPNVLLYGNQLQVFARGIDNNVWQLVYVPGEGWRSWAWIGGPVTSDPVAIVNDGNMNVFARNLSGNVVTWAYVPAAGRWFEQNLGGQIIGAPAVVNYGFQCQVFVRGTDNKVYQKVYDGGWGSSWNPMGGPATTTDVMPVVHGGNMNVFVRSAEPSSEGNLVYRAYQPGAGWFDWHNLGGRIVGKPEALDYGGYFQVFARGTDNGLWQLSYTSGVGWHSWADRGNPTLTTDPAAVIFGPYLNVYSRQSDGTVAYRWFDPNAGWQSWVNLGGPVR